MEQPTDTGLETERPHWLMRVHGSEVLAAIVCIAIVLAACARI